MVTLWDIHEFHMVFLNTIHLPFSTYGHLGFVCFCVITLSTGHYLSQILQAGGIWCLNSIISRIVHQWPLVISYSHMDRWFFSVLLSIYFLLSPPLPILKGCSLTGLHICYFPWWLDVYLTEQNIAEHHDWPSPCLHWMSVLLINADKNE